MSSSAPSSGASPKSGIVTERTTAWTARTRSAVMSVSLLLKTLLYTSLFSRISWVSPHENPTFNTWLFIVMRTSQNKMVKLSPREFPNLVQNRKKYLYAICIWHIQYIFSFSFLSVSTKKYYVDKAKWKLTSTENHISYVHISMVHQAVTMLTDCYVLVGMVTTWHTPGIPPMHGHTIFRNVFT